MSLPEMTVERTLRTEKSLTLNEEQVSNILSDWVKTHYDMVSPTIEFDCSAGGIRDVFIEEKTESTVAAES